VKPKRFRRGQAAAGVPERRHGSAEVTRGRGGRRVSDLQEIARTPKKGLWNGREMACLAIKINKNPQESQRYLTSFR
jgi:hypothetical protein